MVPKNTKPPHCLCGHSGEHTILYMHMNTLHIPLDCIRRKTVFVGDEGVTCAGVDGEVVVGSGDGVGDEGVDTQVC